MLKTFSSKILILLIFFYFTNQTLKTIRLVIEDEKTCLCSYDGFGYYMYLPSLFINNTIQVDKKWAQSLQNQYCDSNFVYQIIPGPSGNDINLYHMGLATLQLPGYIAGHIASKIYDYPSDGFSKPFYITYLLNPLIFILIGLVYLRKLFKLFFNELLTCIGIFITYFGTNLFLTIDHQYDLQHLYLFSLNTIFLYHIIKWYKTRQKKNYIFAVIIFGLATFIRPTEAIFGLIPFFIVFHENNFSKTLVRKLFPFLLSSIIWNIPQFYYWITVGGKLLILNLHTEDIVITDPSIIDFLFSYKKGWLLYSPLFILSIFGFREVYRNNKTIFWGLFSTSIITIYVLASWECWWYSSSFGARSMTEFYSLFILVILFYLNKRKTALMTGAVYIFIGVNVIYSLHLGLLAQKYYLHPERMTKNHYWYIIGENSIPNYTSHHLEIDRENINWPEIYKNKAGYSLDTTLFYSNQNLGPNSIGDGFRIDMIPIYDKLTSDETIFIIEISSKTNNQNKSAEIKFENKSKYNTYSWDGFEISKSKPENEFTTSTFKFNLSRVRHNDDFLHVYVGYSEAIIHVQSIKIRAITLIRK